MQEQWKAWERKRLNAGSRTDFEKIATESNLTYATVKGRHTTIRPVDPCQLVQAFSGIAFSGKTAVLG
jgi:hypothetical protein